MKIVVAPNAFKGSLSAIDAAEAISAGVKHVFPDAELIKIPMADGGDGLLEILARAFEGEIRKFVVSDPLGRPIKSELLLIPEKKTAVIEMAKASGLSLLSDKEKNPMKTSSFGTGQLIKNALDLGAEKIILGIGGSATNDGGTGAASALGIIFKDAQGRNINPCGGNLIKICGMDMAEIESLLKKVKIEVVCDVENPLLGADGAARVYSPQKGATPEQVEELEKGLANLADVIERETGINVREIRGGGAAGGMGAGICALLGASLHKGSEIVMEIFDFEKKIKGADFVFTAEGRIDSQTAFGKIPAVVAESAKRQGIPCVAFAGSVADDISELHKKGITAVFVIAPGPVTLEQSMKNSASYLERTAEQAIRAMSALI